MYKIVIGTTPSIKFVFKKVDPSDFSKAILTFKNCTGQKILQKELDTAEIGRDYIQWTLSQSETLDFGKETITVMLNWLTTYGVRGTSDEVTLIGVTNHIKEVI